MHNVLKIVGKNLLYPMVHCPIEEVDPDTSLDMNVRSL